MLKIAVTLVSSKLSQVTADNYCCQHTCLTTRAMEGVTDEVKVGL